MIEKIFLVIFLVCVSFRSNEQVGASIVYDPTNGAQIASVLQTMKQLKDVNEQWKASSEFLNKIMKEGKEVKRLISLLEGIVCSTNELSLYLGVRSSQLACSKKIQMDIALAKIDGVSGKIQMIATGAIVLSQYETISSLKDLNDELEEAAQSTASLNAFLRSDFLNSQSDEYDANHGYEHVSLLTKMNL